MISLATALVALRNEFATVGPVHTISVPGVRSRANARPQATDLMISAMSGGLTLGHSCLQVSWRARKLHSQTGSPRAMAERLGPAESIVRQPDSRASQTSSKAVLSEIVTAISAIRGAALVEITLLLQPPCGRTPEIVSP